MKLLIKELRKFKSVAGSVRQKGILPIYSYLKFKDGEITKNNQESFVIMEADFKGECLIDEKLLYSFMDSTNANEIDVTIKEKSVILSDGKSKMVSPTDDIINFPISAENDGKEYVFSNEVIRGINIASNFTMERDDRPMTQSIFIGRGIIAASTGFIAYTEKTDEKFPEIVVDRNTVSIIGKFDSVVFSENETYQFYSNHIFKFGFIKKEIPFQPMTFFSVLPKDVVSVEIDKSEIIKFCETCINSCPGRLVIAYIVGDKLTMQDGSYGIDYEKPISVSMEDFCFNPEYMAKLLKSVTDEKVQFLRSKNMYYVTGESGFVSLIMEMKVTN